MRVRARDRRVCYVIIHSVGCLSMLAQANMDSPHSGGEIPHYNRQKAPDEKKTRMLAAELHSSSLVVLK